MCPGATIFPEGPALGSTWNMDLLSRVYATAAREARAIGVHQIFTLVVEPIRDPRLGRNEEAYSEDPFLCSRIAETIARSAQGDDLAAPDKVVSGLCHYPGQSQPVSGLERGAMEISERTLREVFLPPWQAGIKSGGALGVMATYPAIDGVPTHASYKLLTRILREELGFDGLVLSEGGGIGTLVYEGLAPPRRKREHWPWPRVWTWESRSSRATCSTCWTACARGKCPMSLVDRSVRRILKQKFRLGLFEKPLVDPEHAVQTVHQPEHQDLALQAAREAVVLLKNENKLLPLSKSLRSIAVIGPNADDSRNQLGDYIPTTIPQHIVTILEGIKQIVSPGTKVTYVKGCNVTGERVDEIARAREAAASADAAIVVVGENEQGAEGSGPTDGEGHDAATLELTGMQEELVKAVHAAGKPTIVVLVNGRPLAVRWIAQHVPAIVEAWLPGEQGGKAVAEILFGDVNPSGRLSVTVPRHAGQLPVYYNFKKSKQEWVKRGWGHAYVDMEPTPLYPFGFGLGYSAFEYSGLRLSARSITPAEGRRGPRRGEEHRRPFRQGDRPALHRGRDQQRGDSRQAAPRLRQAGHRSRCDENLHVPVDCGRPGTVRQESPARGRARPVPSDGRFLFRRHPADGSVRGQVTSWPRESSQAAEFLWGDVSVPKPGLNRVLGLKELVLYGIVLIQPTAPMPLYGVVCEQAKGHVVTTILIGMVAMLFTAISYGRMAQAYPSAGSAYTYVGRELHPALGYLTGWAMIFDYILNPIICVIWCSKAAMNFLPMVPFPAWAVFFAALFTLLNMRGIKASSRTNEIITACLGVVIILFFVAAVRYILRTPYDGSGRFLRPFYDPDTFSWKAVSTGTSIAMLTYIGFDGISTLSEEAHNPRRNILLATVLVCLVTGVLAASQVYAAQLRLAPPRGLSRRGHGLCLHRGSGRRSRALQHRESGAPGRHDRFRFRLAPCRGPLALRHGPRQCHP